MTLGVNIEHVSSICVRLSIRDLTGGSGISGAATAVGTESSSRGWLDVQPHTSEQFFIVSQTGGSNCVEGDSCVN